MNCPNCGKEVSYEGVSYCPYCGTELKQTSPKRAEVERPILRSYNPWLGLVYVCAAMAIVLFLAGYFASVYSQTEYVGLYPFGYSRTTYPYAQFSFPLIVFAIVVFVAAVGAAIIRRSANHS